MLSVKNIFPNIGVDEHGARCNLCLQHAYEEPSPKMTNLMRGANFDPTRTNPFVVDAYLMFQVNIT